MRWTKADRKRSVRIAYSAFRWLFVERLSTTARLEVREIVDEGEENRRIKDEAVSVYNSEGCQ
jgi:hypothetical protein